MTTIKTISPKNGGGKNKIGEILRLLLAMETLNIQPIDIANKSGLSERTIKNGIYDNKPLSGKLLRAINTHYQVSMDWLASGKGAMFCNTGAYVAEETAQYTSNPRTQRIIDLINEFMSVADADQQAWLETQIKFNLHTYKEYLAKNGR